MKKICGTILLAVILIFSGSINSDLNNNYDKQIKFLNYELDPR
ncbi:hypothetical protein [Longirhabdus pacifica]|nr:hypothetical protein [Longirhabdus pacifica]